MRSSLRLALAGAAILWTGLALADQWGPQVNITGYYIWASSGGVAFITTSNNQNPYGCTNTRYLVLDPSQPNFKYVWATVMAAQATGQTVSLSYTACLGGYPQINAVAVPNTW